jgi:hypothetical protein
LGQPVANQIVPIAPTNSTSTTGMPSGDINKIRFMITNLHDYDLCIDDILLLYEGRFQEHGGKSQCIADIMAVYGRSGLTKQQAIERSGNVIQKPKLEQIVTPLTPTP